MSRIFYRKKFSDYLGEQRAIDDIVQFFTQDIAPTPTPTPVPVSPTPTPSITSTPTPSVTSTLTPTPTNTGSPTPTPTNTGTPQVTPTLTTTPTPTRTPAVNNTLGLIQSTGGSLSGTTFRINYNSTVYPITTLFSSSILSRKLPVPYPQPGRLYLFVLVPDSGFTISSVGISFGAYNRIRITVGASTGLNQWACTVNYMLNASILFTDTGDLVTVATNTAYGQTWNINLTLSSGGPSFFVTAKELANELGDNLTTEDGDVLEIQS